MAEHRRYLSWFLEGHLGPGTPQRETYRLEQPYSPVSCSLHARSAATNIMPDAVTGIHDDWTEVDILADGVSILEGNFLILTKGVTQDFQNGFLPGLELNADALITIDVRQLASGESGTDVTVELVLEALAFTDH